MRIAYVLLAAGNASRFGSCKQLAEVDGQAVIQHSLNTLKTVLETQSADEERSVEEKPTPFVVLGAYQAEITPYITPQASIIVNPDWQLGLGASIAKATEVIDDLNEYDGILFTLADQIKVTVSDLNQLLDGFDGNRISAAFYANKPGVPAIFPSSQFAALKDLVGKNGAKSLLMEPKSPLNRQSMKSALFDIDYPEDIEKY